MRSYSSRAKGRWAFGLASLGVLSAAATIPAAFYLPAYGGARPENTLVEINGTWIVWPLLLLLALSLVAWLGLRASRTSGRKAGTVAAWLLGATAILGFALGALVLAAALAWLFLAGAMLLFSLGAIVLPTALAWPIVVTAIAGLKLGAIVLPAALAVVFAASLTPHAA